jgi:hypothetical protein
LFQTVRVWISAMFAFSTEIPAHVSR